MILYVALMCIGFTMGAVYIQRFAVLGQLSSSINTYIGRTQSYYYALSCKRWFEYLFEQDGTLTLAILEQTKNNMLTFSKGFCKITNAVKVNQSLVITIEGEALVLSRAYKKTIVEKI